MPARESNLGSLVYETSALTMKTVGLSITVGVPLKCIILSKVKDGLGIYGRCAFKAICIGQFWKQFRHSVLKNKLYFARLKTVR